MEKNGVDTVLCVFKSKGAIWFCFCRFNCLIRSYNVQDFLLSSRVPWFWKPKQKVSESCFQGRYTISELIFIMPGKYCCVAWCDNNDVRDSKKLSFHMFPKDERKAKWMDFVSGGTGWTPSKSSVICSAHFTEDMFSVGKKKRMLKCFTIPGQN